MPDLGRKYTCYSCHTKFYDLGKPVPLCPKCGADQRDAEDAPVVTTPRRGRAAAPPPPPVVEEPVDEADFTADEPGPAAVADADEEEDFGAPAAPEQEPEEEEEDEEEF
ncbi:MAG TPA: FYDLN acid domain-containing protein [Thermoanaerobaculia bacterium]|nr:FYDLN acid domain-containing protein [Thermoanaerobaculia bacterium]